MVPGPRGGARGRARQLVRQGMSRAPAVCSTLRLSTGVLGGRIGRSGTTGRYSGSLARDGRTWGMTTAAMADPGSAHFPTGRRFPWHVAPVHMTAVVPADRCGTAPDFHRIPSFAPSRAGAPWRAMRRRSVGDLLHGPLYVPAAGTPDGNGRIHPRRGADCDACATVHIGARYWMTPPDRAISRGAPGRVGGVRGASPRGRAVRDRRVLRRGRGEGVIMGGDHAPTKGLHRPWPTTRPSSPPSRGASPP